MPIPFMMEVVLEPWYLQHRLFCTIAYSPPDHVLNNLLYINCTSEDISFIKLLDFTRDLLYYSDGEVDYSIASM